MNKYEKKAQKNSVRSSKMTPSCKWKTFAKLRISSHKLRIDKGRYDNIPRDERLCSLYNCKGIEDETHFLVDCPSFSSISKRDVLRRLQSHEAFLSHLMNSADYFINIQLRWPEPIYMRVGYVFKWRFSARKIDRFLWFLASLIKNGRTLRNCDLLSCRYRNVWDIGICFKPHFYKKCQ